MTTEQKKAIKVLEQYKNECIEEYKVELNDKKNIDEQHASYLHQEIEAVYLVLNLIQEQEKELKRLDKEAQQYFETIIRQAQEFDSQLQKKDKIIRLMAEFIFQNVYVEEDICDRAYVECTQETAQDITCINCIKQYFERKVENDNFEE